MKQLGYGKVYRYAHDEAEGVAAMDCLPDALAGRRYYDEHFDETLRTGTFGHPWELTLCVIGAELVDSLGPLLSALLPIKRRQ